MNDLSAQLEADIQRRMKSYRQAYRLGYIDALRRYAHWVDGEQFVGTCGKTLAEAIAEFDETYSAARSPAEVPPPRGRPERQALLNGELER